MNYFYKNSSGTIYNKSDEILFISIEDFENNILKGNHCFLCCKPIGTEESKEHILPNWILKKFDLHSKKINLPNGTFTTYGSYTVPCCDPCNKYLGQRLENKFADAITKGSDTLQKILANEGPWELLIWLSLIFFKTHFKDYFFRHDRDLRKPDIKIGDSYNPADFHHIYNVIRAIKNGVTLDRTALSSIFVIALKPEENSPRFDYMDILPSQSIYLKLDNLCIIAVLNDGCGVLSAFQNDFMKLGLLDYIQSKELFAHLSYISQTLKEKPEFQTRIENDEVVICGKNPEFASIIEDRNKFGEILHHCCWPIAKQMGAPPEIEGYLKAGNYTWIQSFFKKEK